MSEHDEDRPMTRRERRLREMERESATQESAERAAAEHSVQDVQAQGGAVASPEEPEISPYNEDGSLRTRAEMRALRAEALAGAEQSPDEEASVEPGEPAPIEDTLAETTPAEADDAEAHDAAAEAHAEEAPADASEEEPEPEATPEEEASEEVVEEAEETASAEVEAEEAPDEERAEEPEAEDTSTEEAPAEEAPSEAVPPTEPFSLGDLHDAERAVADESAEASSAEDAVAEAAPGEELLAEESAEVQPEPRKRFGWRRNKRAEQAEEAVAEDAAVAPEQLDTEPIDIAEAAPAVEIEPILDELPGDEPEVTEAELHESAETVAIDIAAEAAPVEVEPEDEAEPAAEKPAYSFPDIQPPEEWRSVFDDPDSRSLGESAADSSGDFDTLIERAVAQEGAAGSSNTAALIMPTHPEDTGGLTGSLGAKNDLFITGSIELPKSLSETGGSSQMHDSLKMAPISASDLPTDLPVGPGSPEGPTPVAAKSAVSARVPEDTPMMSRPTKDSNKLPLVLGITGGTLLAAIAGLGVWGWMNGFFG